MAVGNTYQTYYGVFAETRELSYETIDKGAVKLAVLYLISAIAYLPVFYVIFHYGKTVNWCQILYFITSFELPFFRQNPVQLHEIQYDLLLKLLKFIPPSGKGEANVMYCLHRCLVFVWRSGRISEMPAFPEKGDYKIVDPAIRQLPIQFCAKCAKYFSTSL